MFALSEVAYVNCHIKQIYYDDDDDESLNS